VVMPALTGSVVSGVAQATLKYGSFRTAPKFVRGTLHALATFALWWALTDVTTQHAARRDVLEWCQQYDNKDDTTRGNTTDDDIPRVVLLRRWSNVVSCLFVTALYGIMVLKPGYHIAVK
jgi:hypothetical protein